jgi:hypothetical protein
MTFHDPRPHPRYCHRKKRFRNRFSIPEMRSRGVWLCAVRHGGIHDLVPDEKTLGWSYNTRQLLPAHEGVRKTRRLGQEAEVSQAEPGSTSRITLACSGGFS